ncbi:MAG: hypothetical protein ACI4GY_07930 [Acutalibacteraceae bacterium]
MDSKKTVLVCVTPQESSKSLVAAGKAIAEKNSATLEVISVLPMELNEEKNSLKIIEGIHHFAKDAGGEMALYFSDEPVLTVAAHIAKTKPMLLVAGFPGENSNDFVSTIHLLVPELPISMVDGKKVYNILPFESSQPVCK